MKGTAAEILTLFQRIEDRDDETNPNMSSDRDYQLLLVDFTLWDRSPDEYDRIRDPVDQSAKGFTL